MSRRLPSLRHPLAALAAAAALTLGATSSYADTCTGLQLAALTPVGAGNAPVAVVTGDFNRDGLLDVVSANSGSSNISVLLGDGTPGGFGEEAGSPTPVGGTPVDLAVGDLDRDGYLDLVVALGTEVKVMRRLPAGGFDNTSLPFAVGPAPTRIYLADLTRDGFLDLVVVSNPGNRISAWQGAGLSFPTSLDVIDVSAAGPPDGPWGAAIADFNRDGKLDLAVAYDSTITDDVYLYFGNGLPAGSFNWTNGPTQTLVSVSGPHDIAAGDVDRDGWPDLVTANLGSSDVSVLRNDGGTALMQAVTPLPVGFPTRVVLADLNQDGLLDLAALDDSATPRVVAFPGTTAAPWFDTAGTAATLPAAAAVRGLAVGHFTADGRVDLVTALSAPRQVVVVENQSGTPCARSSFGAAPRSYLSVDGPVSTAAADFDHDGRRDLVVATDTNRFIRVLRNVNGGFVAGVSIGPLAIAPRAVATADMDVDGDPDVVVAQGDGSNGQVQVYLGNGTGGLTAAGVQPAGLNTSALVIGDFNGDGAPDVAATSEGSGFVYVFLGNGAGGLAAGIQTGVGIAPRALVAGFFDAGNTLDLAVANFLGNDVSILYGNGNGTFAAGPVLGVATNPLGIAAADLDGNGHLDVVTADNGASQVSVILRDGAGGFLAAVGYGTGAGTTPSAVALLDLVGGDGKAEIAVTTGSTVGNHMLTVFSNNGSGVFTFHSGHPVRNSPQAITPTDADSDGLTDLAVPCRSADGVVILLNRPPGPPLFQAAPDADVGDQPRAAASGDFDGDGDLDLAVANSAAGNVSLLAGDGTGGLAQYTTLPAPGAQAVVVADFNRDGDLDLAISAPAASSVEVFFGAAGGAFAPQPAVTSGLITKPDDLVAGDFDRDGDLDIAVCNQEPAGSVVLLRNDGAGGFTVVAGPSVGNKPTAIVAADFDRDGDLDLAVANDDSNDVSILANSSGSFTAAQTLLLAGGETSPVALAAADFDANGLVDLAAASFDFDRIHVYRNQGATFITTPGTFDAPVLLQSLTAADVNLDGRPDLVATAAGVSVFRGRGGMDFDPPETVVARHSPVAAVVADFSRDGRPDVVVVNEGSDDVTILASSACQARRLEVSDQPAGCFSGTPLYFPEVELTAYDDGGNLASCTTETVVPAIAPGTGDPTAMLGGTAVSGLPLAGGVASFTGSALSIDKAGRRYRLRFTTAGMPPVLTRSFTLGPTPEILGPSSVCPATFGTYSLEGTPDFYDTYAWSITPIGPAPYDQNPFAYTPTVALPNPPLTGARTLAVTARVDQCVVTPTALNVYFGNLFSISLDVQGASSVCVDCIGGSAKAVELGGGLPLLRQWGYRTVPASGAITPIPGENSETYVLKGANFPGPGVYYVVVTTTPTCGVATTSSEWMVTVSASVPSGEVRHLAASSRGGPSANTGQTRLLWVNTAAPDEVKIRWNRAPLGTTDCVPPVSLTIPATAPPTTDEVGILAPAANAKDDFLHSGLALDTAYCYSVFVRVGAAWSPGRTVKARPFDATTGPVKWAYATGGTAVAPPTVSGEGILGLSNDRTVHALTRGAAGGEWPGPWMPAQLEGVAHSRSPVVPLVVPLAGPANTVLFAGDDATPGYLHAIDARTGNRPWPQQSQGKPMTGAPGGIFTQYSGIRDALFVGTRDGAVDNELRALDLASGAFLEAYTGASSPGPIGPINGTPSIDYATGRVYFASHKRLGGDTLFCLEIGASSPVFTYKWSRDLGNITGSPVLRDGRVYVGTDAGVVYSVNTLSDGAIGDDHTFSTGDGPVKGFLFPDRRNDDLIFATNTKVWSISDDGAAMALNWEWTTAGLNPSVILYWPRTSYVYVGSANGTLYQLDFSFPTAHASFAKSVILGGGFGQVGAPSLDIGVAPEMLLVGSEPGVIYGLHVPFP